MLQDRKIREVDLLDSSHALGKCGLFETERKMQTFRAFYEDAAKAEVAARALGYTDDDGSLLDYVEPHDYRTGKSFETLAAAEQWLKSEIEAMRTMFGCGTVRVLEPVTKRCRYCVCGGKWRAVQEYTVDDTGIVEDEALGDECCN
jgi:hypothetical protein